MARTRVTSLPCIFIQGFLPRTYSLSVGVSFNKSKPQHCNPVFRGTDAFITTDIQLDLYQHNSKRKIK